MDNEDICKRFGQNVRRIRRAKELSQEKLAEIADLHRTYITGLERGSGRNPTIRAADKIAKALGVSISALFE
jgi:transcriptional regulator with XRE-family HTH domain